MSESESKIKLLETEIASLEKLLEAKKSELVLLKNEKDSNYAYYNTEFSCEEIVKYSRQMIMPQITISGQIALKKSKILIVGAGGLGCPSSLYLAAAGVGEIHIIDYDNVELSNLHRQILYNESDVGLSKVQSVSDKLKKINSNIKIIPMQIHANNSSILQIIQTEKFNVVLDCTDNAPTRYLLNDICVLNDIPLVSGSALQMEGQLTVYHYKNSPCYRCLFPKPPPAQTVTNCGDGGVLGAVVGVIGVLQALEAVKIITEMGGVLAGRLLLFDGCESIFRNVKLRKKNFNCDICGENPKILEPVDYEQFCGSKADDKVTDIDMLKSDDNVDVQELSQLLNNDDNIILDVRPEFEYAMCKLPNTVNLPYPKILTDKGINELRKIVEERKSNLNAVFVLCRRGNDSQRTISCVRGIFPLIKFKNVKGGLRAYSKCVDSAFPIY